ncbi:MAG TPA: replicative DNA helicase [Acholeplasmataceae bacterium]|jgi:replicative DNA helicase|nr:replicative DNA helicase [Acholeplasmataceae bacterium]HRX44635.1 replicative DNA helicase [Acholeplasmataceae bacterium]
MAKSLPHHQEAEMNVLGTIFLDPKEILTVIDQLNNEDFFDQGHQLIFQAMKDLQMDQMKIDYTSVAAKLEASQQLAKVGGIKYLLQLSEFVPSTRHLETYIDLVKDSALKRETISLASEILEKGYQGEMDASDYVTYAEESIFALAQKRKTSAFAELSEVIREVKEKTELNRDKKGGITGLRTGFSNLDNLTAGLQPEELIILAARPSMGKSAYAMNLALNVAKRNADGQAGVAIFSLEMSNEQLAARMLSAESNIENNKIKTGHLTSREWQFLEGGMQSLSRLKIMFDDSASVSVADIRAKCRKLSQEGRLDFVVIDYLQLIKGDDRSGNRQEEVAKISRSLKQMARELKIPILALSQLSREVEKREDKRPLLADLRESGSIEQDADIVMFLYREDYYERKQENKTGEVELSIAKNRQGMAGVVLKYRFDTEFSRFTAQSDREEEAFKD